MYIQQQKSLRPHYLSGLEFVYMLNIYNRTKEICLQKAKIALKQI